MTRAAAKPQITIPAEVLDAVLQLSTGLRRACGDGPPPREGVRRWWERQLKARGIAVEPRKARAKK